MTKEQHISIRTNFIHAHFINEIAKWMKDNSMDKFKKLTGFSEDDFQNMVDLSFEWDIRTAAKITVATGLTMYAVARYEKEDE